MNYQLKFNPQTSLYDCFMNVKEGNAFTKRDRIQFNAQVSFVLPSHAEMTISETHMPIQDNQNYNGLRPSKWYISNKIDNPSDLPGQKLVSVAPELSPTGLYNELREGDEVKLFSIRISPLPLCGEGFRLYDNNSDPKSSAKGLRGGDFSNGFTIGSTAQKYGGNLPTVNPSLPMGEIQKIKHVFENENAILDAGSWQNAISFAWTGPNGFISNSQNPVIQKISSSRSGTYSLTVTSKEGCKTEKSMVLVVDTHENLEKAESAVSVESESVNNRNGFVEYSSKVFPNPACSFINISVIAAKGAKVVGHIYSIDGRIIMPNVLNQTMDGQFLEKTIPLKLTGGLYMLRLSIGEDETEHRFLCIE
ncbi:MAG: T9SS type A sorting domain-containing protein [Saprospiraceae bacterium]|nr:T9SS type A sorting domain-containing protein [Saprospiraceae bacterium]